MQIKIWVLVHKNISNLIEVQFNVLFSSAFWVEVDVKMSEKESPFTQHSYGQRHNFS